MITSVKFNPKVCSLVSCVISLFMLSAGYSYGETKPIDNPKIIVSHAISIHGQPTYPADFKHFNYASPEALKGGEIRLQSLGSYDSLNPYIAKGNPASKITLMYDTLTTPSQDEASTEYGLVAEKIEYPEDRSWVMYHINPKAKFHDGKQITAKDVIFSFKTLVSKGAPLYASYYADVKDVVEIDSLKVKFIFKNAGNKELAIIVGSIPILPEHYWNGKTFDKSDLTIPLGSGPYKVKSLDAGKSITYERVKDYWAKDLAVNVGLYNFDRIVVDYYRDDTVMTEALKAKQVDFRRERTAKTWEVGYDTPAVKLGYLKKQSIRDYSPRGMRAYVMNLRKAPFDKIKFREALNYAFDFEWENKNLFYSTYTRVNSYFYNSDLASSGLPQGRELEVLIPFKSQLPESVFTAAFKNPVTDGSGNNRSNLTIAKKLLSDTGYTIKDGQLIDPVNHSPVVIEFMAFDPTFERELNPYAENLKRLGIQLNIKMVDTSQFLNRINKHDFDMTSLPILESLSPGNEQRDFWSSASADIEGSSNYSGIKNPVVDALVDLIVNSPNREELVVRTRALDRVLLHNHYVVPKWDNLEHRLIYWDKFDQPEIAPKFDLFFEVGLMTWWINPEKAKKIDAAKN